MRVSSEKTELAVAPGASTALTIDVRNTDDVIAGVSANVIGLADELVRSEPRMLPLFPDASGQLRVDLAVPRDYPAGRHAITVELVAHGSAAPPDYLDVDLDVDARPGLRLTARPRIARARRNGRFVLELVNTGNVPLDVRMKAADADRQTEITFTPERRVVEPGTIVPVLMRVKGPRMLVGSEVERSVEVRALARQVLPGQPLYEEPVPHEPTAAELADRWVSSAEPDEPPADDEPLLPPEPESDDELSRAIVVRLKQRPLIGRGMLTIFILLAILALWAGAFLFGLLKVFAEDPPTKQAPASFFASVTDPDKGGGTGTSNLVGSGSAPTVVPAGALDRSGQVPPGTGGTITGRVVAATDRQPVGGILVTAYRLGRNSSVQMSAAATAADGTFSLTGLFPTLYRIQFSKQGFDPVWFPAQKSQATAQWIAVDAQQTTAGINAVVTGHRATISGIVEDGSTTRPAITTVTARPLLGASTGKVAARATTDGQGRYTLRNLPAPASYQLTFQTPGYQLSTLTETVSGGDRRIEPTVTVGANQGSITGLVTDEKGDALGGATVKTTVDGRTISVGTPTTGEIGRYVISGLDTPATYVITVSAPDRGATTRIVAMRAGQSSRTLNVALTSGEGSLNGTVSGPKGRIGAATVTVTPSSGGTALTTTTFTGDGSVGKFVVNGIRGRFVTVTVAAQNYQTTTVAVDIVATPVISVPMSDAAGALGGRVRTQDGNRPAAGATVTATNGKNTFTTTADSSSGAYTLSGLPPGWYSVTATLRDHKQRTAVVEVKAGDTTRVDRIALPDAD